jgi:hypothetical protein
VITVFNLSTFSRVSVLDIPFDFRSKNFSEIMFEKFNLKGHAPSCHGEKERERFFAELIYATVANQYDSNGSGCLCATTLQRSSYLVILKV